MREIKFRARALADNEIIYFKLHQTEPHMKGDDFFVGDVLCRGGTEEQYTGLKDKNGKEIYEGDIVTFDDQYYSLKSPTVVELQPPRLWLIGETMGYEGEELIDPDQCEIIGNIYENKELIK